MAQFQLHEFLAKIIADAGASWLKPRAMFRGLDMHGTRLTLKFILMRPRQRFRVFCSNVWDYGFHPEFTLLEGAPELQLIERDKRLDPKRLASRWCQENMPDGDPANARLFVFSHRFVIAGRFTVEADPPTPPFEIDPAGL